MIVPYFNEEHRRDSGGPYTRCPDIEVQFDQWKLASVDRIEKAVGIGGLLPILT